MEAIVTKATVPQPNPFAFGGPWPRRASRASPAPPAPEVKVGDGPVKMVSAKAEQMFLDIKPGTGLQVPQYKGDLELINHSAGSLTSETYINAGIARMKSWPMRPRKPPWPPSGSAPVRTRCSA